jgi:ABC-type oligopeptide transport system substrate-binding subunit
MRRLRWAALAALVLALLVAPAASVDPLVTDPASLNQEYYPVVASVDVGPGEFVDTFASCQFNEVTGTYDQLIRYTVTTTGTVELDSGPSWMEVC